MAVGLEPSGIEPWMIGQDGVEYSRLGCAMIYVCSLAELPVLMADLRPTHIVSMLGDEPFPATPNGVGDHLR